MLDNLPSDTLPRLMRRTTVIAMIVSTVAVLVALVIGSAWGAVGLALGSALAIANLRMLDRQVARVETGGETSTKKVRRQLGSKTAGRLGIMTLVVVLGVIIARPLGIGIVCGLVLYQIVFVANVARVVAAQGGTE